MADDRQPLSPRQQEAFEIVKAYLYAGHQPTFAEIARSLGITDEGARNLLVKCKSKGYLDWDKFNRESIRIIQPRVVRRWR